MDIKFDSDISFSGGAVVLVDKEQQLTQEVRLRVACWKGSHWAYPWVGCETYRAILENSSNLLFIEQEVKIAILQHRKVAKASVSVQYPVGSKREVIASCNIEAFNAGTLTLTLGVPI